MVDRDEAKRMANKSGCTDNWQTYCTLINHVTKLNKNKKKLFYETKISYIKNEGKKHCKLCFLGGKGELSCFMDSDGSVITKPSDVAKYFNDFFNWQN
jgi:hypothetical protein